MGYTKVSGLKDLLSIIKTDALFYIVQDGKSYKIKYDQLKSYLGGLDSVGFLGIATPTTNPTSDGFYIAKQPGTYTNFGNFVISSSFIGFAIVYKYGNTSAGILIELPSNFDGNIALNQTTKGVNGDKVFRHTIQKSFTIFDPNILTSLGGYSMYNIVFYQNKVYMSNVNNNMSTPGINEDWGEIKFGSNTDLEFDENSENPIANKAITKFVNNIKSEEGEQFIVLSPASQTTTNGFYRQVYPLIAGKKYRLKVWQVTTQNTAVMQYTGGGELYVSPIITTSPTDYTVIEYTPIQSGNLIFFAKTDKPDCKIEEIVSLVAEKYYVDWDKGYGELLENKKEVKKPIKGNEVVFNVPPTPTGNFFDVDNVPLLIGHYELQIFQSDAFVASALKVDGFLVRDIAPKATNDSERINIDENRYSHIFFEVTEENSTIDLNIRTIYPNCKLWHISFQSEFEKVYLTPDDLDESLNDLSVLTKSSSATIPEPRSILRIDFDTNENLPTAKGTKINGVFKYNDFQGNSFRKFAKLEVQGTSSATYPKKNWTLSLFNDENRTDSFKLEIGNLIAHDEFVYKADYVDITHSHNIVGNELWEQFVLSRKGFPKRETDVTYSSTNTAIDSNRFDSKALGHVRGFACEMYINGIYYGLGNFNIGKKRPNYNIDNTNRNHIQLGDSVGQQDITTFIPTQWELRSPKVSGYEEGGEIPDAEIMAKINRLLTFNGSVQSNITANIDSYYMRRNIVDYYIFSQSIYNFDGVAKNYLLTSWDSNVFAFMPYDLDSIFGMQFNGTSFFSPTASVFNHQNIPSGSLQFWQKVRIALGTDLDIRYKYLRDSGILSLENLYILLKNQETKYGLERIQKEFSKWNARPTLNSIPRIMNYMQQRFVYLDAHFNYIP